MPGTKIGASVAAKPKRVKSKKNPYTQKQYDQVLRFFQKNAGNFYTVNEVDEQSGVENTAATQAIIAAQVADPKTRVTQDLRGDKYGILSPYTQEQYDSVLKFFRENAGNFYTVNEVDEGAKIGSEVTTQAIISAQLSDPKTGVQQDPKSSKYGIPKKKK